MKSPPLGGLSHPFYMTLYKIYKPKMQLSNIILSRMHQPLNLHPIKKHIQLVLQANTNYNFIFYMHKINKIEEGIEPHQF
jgi:hypothetical protein